MFLKKGHYFFLFFFLKVLWRDFNMLKEKTMYNLAELLLIIGGLNWGLAIFEFNLVTFLFGSGILTTVVYAAVGLSAAWLAWFKWLKK
jgi:uncharacterized membrane protein YuzA (DUF378 family)